MGNELKTLKKHNSDLEYLNSKYDQPEDTIKYALRQVYEELEKRILQQTANLISINKQLQQEIAEHQQIEYALYYRAEFEKLIVAISTHFLKLSKDKIHSAIRNALQMIGEFIGVDHCYVFFLSRNGKRIGDIYEWRTKGIKLQIQSIKGHLVDKKFPWFAKKIKRHGVLHVANCDTLPPEARAEKEYFLAYGIQSFIAIPMFYGKSFIGYIGFDSVRVRKKWTVDIIVLLRNVGEIFANALTRNWPDNA
jgi:transcriptional regulator with GAF, ATPase, and Fis domain